MSAELARRAAALIREHGLCRGKVRDEQGRLCMYGALHDAAGCIVPDVTEMVQQVITEQFPDRVLADRFCVISLFNDHPDTTVEDVIAVLEKTAAQLEEST